MTATPLLDWTPPTPPRFDGATFDAERDGARLNAQCQRVYNAMKSGSWKTLEELNRETGDPEASCSARLRDLRKPRFGSHVIEREFVRRGLWRYRMTA